MDFPESRPNWVACPACRSRLVIRMRAEAFACDNCNLLFPAAFWWPKDGELYPARRHPNEPSSSSTSGP
jgi:ribosomal protein L37AE/L43A